ncbi:GDP-mannose 4,6-dehydratase [Thalassospira lucentensis]|uniref:GDP-mannose 4,6-dehydratase n=1 Tax=Thalassospira lucentensis TaxID=168935 RepID=UPI0029432B06|nr:GDP-mannose 4,6-dehydratase [Thalassospira lucentensis]WOI11827.1 GDP-mannose 4,6-dehydratase [Thalassospira lucentensis]
MKPVAVVTGGAGFIGSHMVDLLVDRGYAVRVVDNLVGGRAANLDHHSGNPNVELHELDIRDLKVGNSIFADAKRVFHFAGIGDIVPSIEHPSEYMSVNVQGTVNVLECARAAGSVEKLVYAASSSCYGLAQTPTKEDHVIDTKYPYALSKYQGEQAALHWGKVYDLPVNSVRIFNAYGTRSRTSGAYGAVFGVFLKQKLAGKPFTVVGDGTQTRDFLYVTDVAEAFFAASDVQVSGEIYNLGASKPQSVNRLVELLGGEVVHIPKRPGEPDCTWADTTKINHDLGWKPRVSFEEGVKRIVDNIDYWRDAPLWDVSSIETATKTWFQYMQD